MQPYDGSLESGGALGRPVVGCHDPMAATARKSVTWCLSDSRMRESVACLEPRVRGILHETLGSQHGFREALQR
jgi:hypothetical protein